MENFEQLSKSKIMKKALYHKGKNYKVSSMFCNLRNIREFSSHFENAINFSSAAPLKHIGTFGCVQNVWRTPLTRQICSSHLPFRRFFFAFVSAKSYMTWCVGGPIVLYSERIFILCALLNFNIFKESMLFLKVNFYCRDITEMNEFTPPPNAILKKTGF